MDLFNQQLGETNERIGIAPDAYLLIGFALEDTQALEGQISESPLLAALEKVILEAPLRRMITPGGYTMSVAMSNCGKLGWVTSRAGYRYTMHDPVYERPWPAMPPVLADIAQKAALKAGFADFQPDACLINHYGMGARMALHQDKDERDYAQPIVSVSLGLSATFHFGGFERTDKPLKLILNHGDVVVWGGASRLRYHGVLPLKAGLQPSNIPPLLKDCRINLTFRKAG